MKHWITATLLLTSILSAGCESAEKYKKAASSADSTRVTGAIHVQGTQSQMGWARQLATGIETAKKQWEHQNAQDAIAAVDSLSRLAEAALDTVTVGSQIGSFLLIYSADAFQHLIAWQKTMHRDSAAEASAQRYQVLGARLRQRAAPHDSAAASAIP